MEEVSPNKRKHKKVLKALLCALGITVVYGIIIYFIPKGGLDGLAYLFFTPVVFICGFLFYYIFDYFKSIHKLPWLFSVSGILLFLIMYNSGVWNMDIWLRNQFHSNKLPSLYAGYRDINQPPLKFGSRTINLLYESEENIDHYLTINDNLIIKREKKGEENSDHVFAKYEFTKLDPSGNISDTYSYVQKSYKDEELLFEGYLINANQAYYKTWPLDGDSSRKNIIIQNENLEWDEGRQIELYRRIQGDASVFYTDYDHSLRKEGQETIYFQKIVYKIGDDWFIFFENLNEDKKGYPYVRSRGKTINNIFGHPAENGLDWVDNVSTNIESLYFEKIKLTRLTHIIGGNTPASKSDEWLGYLYTNLIVGKDTLKFKDQFYLDEEWQQTPVTINGQLFGTLSRPDNDFFTTYLYFENKNLHYKLFANSLRKLYIIK
ncbi:MULTISPECIES: hypothetical protein [unclassified Sphingobacterium]|uniref:hypothetical protein n=1 Tax=unclassified Sphingobacterium TaxID=2609468 RepID=UPI0025E2C45A|nr:MULTISPECIES: hypothetical protein [unclassified Sphingobacterium]